MFYSMGEVAEMLDVNPSLIRFWEKKFDIIKPHKNKKGNRMFTPADVENLKLIYHLTKEQKMKLDGVQKRLKANLEGERDNAGIIERLQGIKALLMEVRQELKLGDVIADDPAVATEPLPAAVVHAAADTTGFSVETADALTDTALIASAGIYREADADAIAEYVPAQAYASAEEPLPRIVEQTLF